MVSKNILFIFTSIFFLIGVFINNLSNDIYISLIVLLGLVVLFLGYFLYSKKYQKVLIISLLGFMIGIIVSDYSLNNINNNEKIIGQFYNKKDVEYIYIIDEVNKKNEFTVEYIANLINIGDKKIDKEIKGLLNIDKNYDLSKGDVIKTNSKIFELEDFNGFSYKKYMLSKNIYLKSNIFSFETVDKVKVNKIENNIINLRKYFLDVIYEIYPGEEAIFLGGILLGARESLSPDLKQDFNNSGLTHFIAVSGFNITIIIIFLSMLVKYFPVFLRAIIITAGIVFFTILVGDTAPVIRASIMGLIGYYVLISGRKGNMLSIILLTASIMVFLSPLSINYDISFHLSFLAVLGIIYTNKFFEDVFHFLPNVLEIKTAFTLTLSAMTLTLPIMMFNFGQVSILAPLANVAVTWTIPIAMLFGFLSIIVYFVYPIAGIIVGYLTWIFLKWDIIVVHFFGKLDWSIIKIDFGVYKNYLEILYFMVLVFIILWFRKDGKKEDKS
ncbi:MAG: ComEC/Rec2 family competence protein [Candidatus Gracilibacteria bacterium]|nr:ComEC/Rec2 family competence protein [Candidatus Gracilibacteria bacterium]